MLDKRYKHDISVVVDRLVMRHDVRKRLADSIETAVGAARKGSSRSRSSERQARGRRHRRSAARATGAKGARAAAVSDRPGRGARAGNGVHVLRAVRLPRARAVAGRARAEDLLVQLAARGVRALHGARLADGDRPGAGRARPGAVDRARARSRRGRTAPRTTTSRSTEAIAERYGVDLDTPWEELPEEQRDLFLYGTDGEPAAGHLSQPLRPRGAPTRRGSRGSCTNLAAPLPRDRLRVDAREDRGVHVAARLPGVRRRAAAAGVPRGARRGDARSRSSARCRRARALEWLEEVELSETDRHVARLILREISERLQFLENVGIGYLSMDRAAATLSGGEAQRIRLATQIGSLARRRAVHPRRALDRPAPARQLEADRRRSSGCATSATR